MTRDHLDRGHPGAPTPGLTLRPIERSGIDAALALLRDVARWLDGMGRRERISSTSFETYLHWQACGGNWGVFERDTLAAIFTLIREPLHDWPDVPTRDSVPWLRALAVLPARRGHGIGAWAVRSALELVDCTERLYLDCVSDFLPGFYACHGFERMARQVRTYPDGEYDITLMCRRGRRTGDAPSRGGRGAPPAAGPG